MAQEYEDRGKMGTDRHLAGLPLIGAVYQNGIVPSDADLNNHVSRRVGVRRIFGRSVSLGRGK